MMKAKCEVCNKQFKSLHGVRIHMQWKHLGRRGKKEKEKSQEETPPPQFTLALFLQALQQAYLGDPTAPGIIIAQLRDGNYYAAIHRYHGKFGADRWIVASVKDPKLGVAIRTLAKQWVNSPLWELRRRINADEQQPTYDTVVLDSVGSLGQLL